MQKEDREAGWRWEPRWRWGTKVEIRNQGQKRVSGCTVRAKAYTQAFQAFPISGAGQGEPHAQAVCLTWMEPLYNASCSPTHTARRRFKIYSSKTTCWGLLKAEEFLVSARAVST